MCLRTWPKLISIASYRQLSSLLACMKKQACTSQKCTTSSSEDTIPTLPHYGNYLQHLSIDGLERVVNAYTFLCNMDLILNNCVALDLRLDELDSIRRGLESKKIPAELP